MRFSNFSVDRNATVKKLIGLLDTTDREEDVQRFLSHNSWILLDCFALPWAVRECIPKFKLGNEYITDFFIVTGQSFRYDFILVELEPPRERLFTKSGTPAKKLAQAMKQISDWNTWIAQNNVFFRREVARSIRDIKTRLIEEKRSMRGLDYDAKQFEHNNFSTEHLFSPTYPPRITFKIVIGRRKYLSCKDNERRASLCEMAKEYVEIITYDRLIQATKETINKKK